MIAIALFFVRMLSDCFKPRSRLEAEIVVLRHHLNVLRLRAPRRLYLRWSDRVLFVWLYRRFPLSLLKNLFGLRIGWQTKITTDDLMIFHRLKRMSATGCESSSLHGFWVPVYSAPQL